MLSMLTVVNIVTYIRQYSKYMIHMGDWEGFLTHAGFIVPTNTMKKRFGPAYAGVLKKLTIVHRQKIGPPKIATMYTITKYNGVECIHLPRTLIKTLLDKNILNRVNVMFSPVRPIAATLQIELYENQTLLIDYLCATVYTPERMCAGTATALLNLRAGMGKTYNAGGLISRLGMRALYIVPKRPLAEQAVKDLRLCLYPDDGSKPSTIVGMYGKVKKSDPTTLPANQGVTVIVINSALSRDREFFAGYSFVILDEVHSYCSAQRRQIFNLASTHCMLGMSATTEDRADEFDPIAHKALAFDGIIRAENVPGFTYEDVIFNCTNRIIYYNGPSQHTQNLTHPSTDRIFTHYMHNQFIEDPYRLQLAVDELIRLYDWSDGGRRHNIYVFAEEIEILAVAKKAVGDVLRQRHRDDIIDDMGFEEGIDDVTDKGLEMFTGRVKPTRITQITQSARVLFSTYSYAGTGISILKMSAIMLLTPRRANMKQIIARILRRGSDIEIPRIVVDIVDNKTALKYQLGSRKIAYELYAFKEEIVKIAYTDINCVE